MALLFAVALCVLPSASALAIGVSADSVQRELSFDASNFDGLRGKELGRAKLLASGHSQSLIDTMSDEVLEKIAHSPGGYQTETYMAEVLTEDGFELVETTKAVFENELLKPKVLDTSNITVLDETGNVIYAPGDQISTYNVAEDVDGGTVQVITSFYSIEDAAQPSHFLVVSEFLWSSMPDYRGTDYFGITRDSYVAIYPGSFGNPVKGFAIELSVPGDVNPPPSMFVGQNVAGMFCYAFRGGCYFEGVVSQPSIVPTNFNIWTTYLHQKSTAWILSPSVSVPLGASLGATPEKRYSDPVVDLILVTWRG